MRLISSCTLFNFLRIIAKEISNDIIIQKYARLLDKKIAFELLEYFLC